MSLENLQLQTAAITDRGLSEKRPQNEDSYLSLPEYGIFAVADGVGGAMGGDVASQMAVEVLGEAFVNFSGSVSAEEILTVAIEKANYSINQMAGELPQLAGMASTIVAIHFSEDTATIAHVGDSRLYRVDREGYIHQETADHSVVEEAVRAGQMTHEQAAIHPNRNVISRAVGAEITVDIDIKTIALEPSTTFVLCSDGITRHISDAEIRDLMMTGMSVEMLCEQLREMCYSRGAEDNLTAVIVKIPKTAEIAGGLVLTSSNDDQIVADIEEETVASSRPMYAEPSEMPTLETFDGQRDDLAVAEEAALSSNEIEQPPVFSGHSDELDDEAYLMEEDLSVNQEVEPLDLTDELSAEDERFAAVFNEHEPAPVKENYESSRMIVPANTEPTPERDVPMFGERTTANVTHERSAVSGGSNVFRSILFLLLGGVIGAAAFYFGAKQFQPEPVQNVAVQDLTPKTSNIPASTLEELRWNVDKDPEAYLKARSASPRDAVDHYILGRALFLTGEYWNAENQFKIVDSRKDTIEPKDSANTIAAEIAMMRAIINDGQATESFKRTFETIRKETAPASNTAAANASSSSNVNSSPANSNQ